MPILEYGIFYFWLRQLQFERFNTDIYLFKDFNVVGLKSGVFHFEKLQFCVSHNNLKLKKRRLSSRYAGSL